MTADPSHLLYGSLCNCPHVSLIFGVCGCLMLGWRDKCTRGYMTYDILGWVRVRYTLTMSHSDHVNVPFVWPDCENVVITEVTDETMRQKGRRSLSLEGGKVVKESNRGNGAFLMWWERPGHFHGDYCLSEWWAWVGVYLGLEEISSTTQRRKSPWKVQGSLHFLHPSLL